MYKSYVEKSVFSTYYIHQILGQRSFWAARNRVLIEGALFEIGLKKSTNRGILLEIGSKRALIEDLVSFSMSTNPRRALIEGALSEDLVIVLS